ncbi:Uncharacterised protein [Klebsiella pneumoniae]|nr:Uncharacterised protein [Klebsiella pneumoniae]
MQHVRQLAIQCRQLAILAPQQGEQAGAVVHAEERSQLHRLRPEMALQRAVARQAEMQGIPQCHHLMAVDAVNRFRLAVHHHVLHFLAKLRFIKGDSVTHALRIL